MGLRIIQVILAWLGIGIITYGLWLAWQPLAFAFIGSWLIFLGVGISTLRREKSNDRADTS